MYPRPTDNNGYIYHIYNYPYQLESGQCWIVKRGKLQIQEARTKNIITSKM